MIYERPEIANNYFLTQKIGICKYQFFWFNILYFLKLFHNFFLVQKKFLPMNAPIKKMAGMYTKETETSFDVDVYSNPSVCATLDLNALVVQTEGLL